MSDTVEAVRSYINEITRNVGQDEMKALIMDNETIGIVSLVFTQTELLRKNFFYFEKIENLSSWSQDNSYVRFIKAIFFCRPIKKNIIAIQKELSKPKFGSYFIYFSNKISDIQIKQIAQFDTNELVMDLREFYCDFYPFHSYCFTLNIEKSCRGDVWLSKPKTRTIDGLVSLLYSLQSVPIIRYVQKSPSSESLAKSIHSILTEDDTKNSTSSDLLLIMHRSFDPLTPLIFDWSYQSMLHEIYSIKNNRIVPSTLLRPENRSIHKEITLSSTKDLVFKENMFLIYGEFAKNMTNLIKQYKNSISVNAKLDTLEDIKKFIENYPSYQKSSQNLVKHITLATELSEVVQERHLFEISEFEQNLIFTYDHSKHLKRLKSIKKKKKCTSNDALRLVLLFVFRYGEESTKCFFEFKNLLSEKKVEPEKSLLLDIALNYSSSINRPIRLFDIETKTELKNALNYSKKVITDLKGMENTLTQHKVQLSEILAHLLKGTLNEKEFPYLSGSIDSTRARRIFIFVIGGITYKECAMISKINSTPSTLKFILGGTFIHNSKR